MNKIPFMDLSDCYEQVYNEIMRKINKLINNTRFIGGEEVEKFEKEFAEYCNVNYCVGCGNGTDALTLALRALGIGSGDKVITVPNTFIATAEAITNVGADVDFVDVEEKFYTMDPKKLRNYLENKDSIEDIKAIIPVHLYGQMANMEEIMDVAEDYNLKVIEDAAQAHGAEFRGGRPGEYGDLATFSFYPGKNLGAFGDAGAVVTNDEELYKNVRMLSDHGRLKGKYKHVKEGYNSRLDSIQAGVLRVKLSYLEEWTKQRINNARCYNEILRGKLTIPVVREEAKHVYHLYVIRTKKRAKVREKLSQEAISTGIHYPIPLHLQPAYDYLEYKAGDFPISEKLSDQIVSLPMWPELSCQQIKQVCKLLLED